MRPTPTIAEKVHMLSGPSAYGDRCDPVEARETHMSWVFLTEQFVYKLKKPVRYEDLDFRSIAARRTFCDEELRLNRRLAASVYLGLVALTVDRHGKLSLEGNGRVIDWLVKMRRLPSMLMLDEMITSGSLKEAAFDAAITKLCRFYRDAPPIVTRAESHVHALAKIIELNAHELKRPCFALSAESIDAVTSRQQKLIRMLAPGIGQRASAGRIVDGHGDLRPEHICLEPDPQIIDCIEFSAALRRIDPIDDLGFLTLECSRLGAPHLHERMLGIYQRMLGELPGKELICFYQSVRAMTRARLAIRHLLEEQFRGQPKWRQRAEQYLALALQRLTP